MICCGHTPECFFHGNGNKKTDDNHVNVGEEEMLSVTTGNIANYQV